MKFIFKDTVSGSELVAPVTPSSFEISHGTNIETVNIHTLGDVIIGGYPTLANIRVELLLPARAYPFVSARGTDPYEYVKRFKAWNRARTVLRFIVSDTDVNLPVLINDITYGEKDGTRDVYAKIELREYRYLAVTQTQNTAKTENAARTTETAPPPTTETYTIVSGDTLSAICRKFYGDAALYPQLASYNGIKNPNLIYTGNTLQIPEKNLLLEAG